MEGAHRQFHPIRRRGTPIPVAPPRIPTPMPPNNNNGPSRSTNATKDTLNEDCTGKSNQQSTVMPPSMSGPDTHQQRLISKAPFRLLDNDVKTAWINPRLISKVDLDIIKKTDYVPSAYERNMNGQPHHHHQQINNPHHLMMTTTASRTSSCGRVHDREWEHQTSSAAVNGRSKHGTLSVPTVTLTGANPENPGVVSRRVARPKIAVNLRAKNMPLETSSKPLPSAKSASRSKLPQSASRNFKQKNVQPVVAKNPIALSPQALNTSPFMVNGPHAVPQLRGMAYHQQNLVCDSAGRFGVYAETKYVYAVNTVGNNLAQASAAAAFFARFRDISIKFPGASHDAVVFRDSDLFRRANILLPTSPKEIEGKMVPLMLVGDPAYPLLPWLLKPYTGVLDAEEESFNCYLSSSRIIVENSIGRLKARWRCILKRVDIKYSFVPSLVSACCVLHNIVETNKESFVAQWMEAVHQAEILLPQPNRVLIQSTPLEDSKAIRDHLKGYMARHYAPRQSIHRH